MTLEPLTLTDMSTRKLADAAKLCLAVNVNFTPSTTQSGITAVTGLVCYVLRMWLHDRLVKAEHFCGSVPQNSRQGLILCMFIYFRYQ